jgi:hypothetical protein
MRSRIHARRTIGLEATLAVLLSALLLPGCKKDEEPSVVVKLPPGLGHHHVPGGPHRGRGTRCEAQVR